MQAQSERETDLVWIDDNLDVLAPFALENYKKQGRGALVIDLADLDSLGGEETFRYALHERLPSLQNPQVVEMVGAYQPDEELVVILLPLERIPANYQVSLMRQPEEEGTPKKQSSERMLHPNSKQARSSWLYRSVYVFTTPIQVVLCGVYLVFGVVLSGFGLAAAGGGGSTETEAINFVVSILAVVLICISLSFWLHFRKKQIVIALVVISLPPLILRHSIYLGY